MIRCFIAIPVGIPDSLKHTRDKLKRAHRDARIRWVDDSLMHLTLRFFGDIGEETAKELSLQMARIFGGFDPIETGVTGLGAFFDRKRSPKVIWAGLYPADQLIALREALDHYPLLPKLPGTNRYFAPHLTLARIRYLPDKARFLQDIESGKEMEFGRVRMDRIVLFRSILSQAGPEYIPLHEYELTGGQSR